MYMITSHRGMCLTSYCLLFFLELPSLSAPQARYHSFPRCSTDYLKFDLHITNSPCTLLHHIQFSLRCNSVPSNFQKVSSPTSQVSVTSKSQTWTSKSLPPTPCWARLSTASTGGNISPHTPVSASQPPMAGWSWGSEGKCISYPTTMRLVLCHCWYRLVVEFTDSKQQCLFLYLTFREWGSRSNSLWHNGIKYCHFHFLIIKIPGGLKYYLRVAVLSVPPAMLGPSSTFLAARPVFLAGKKFLHLIILPSLESNSWLSFLNAKIKDKERYYSQEEKVGFSSTLHSASNRQRVDLD